MQQMAVSADVAGLIQRQELRTMKADSFARDAVKFLRICNIRGLNVTKRFPTQAIFSHGKPIVGDR